jgi:hypothetical protein
MKLSIQQGDLLNRGFLSSNAGHFKFQLPDILTRPGGDHGFSEFEIILPGKYVGEDVRSVEWGPLWCAMPGGGIAVDTNDANILASERFTTEGAGRRETWRSLGDDLFATA